MKKYYLLLLIGLLATAVYGKKKMTLFSPEKTIKVEFCLSDKIYYDIYYNDEVLLKDNYLRLLLDDEILGDNPKLLRQKRNSFSKELKPVVPLKFSSITSCYNALTLDFKGYSVEFFAFDDGVAYRFITRKTNKVEVLGEDFAISFPEEYLLHLQQPSSFKTPYEEEYTHVTCQEWKGTDKMSVLPILIDTRKQYKILVGESDRFDYPCMFLKGNGYNGFNAVFPKAPLEFAEDGNLSMKITKEADYIAKTEGNRNYPWRYFVISSDDSQLIENTMNYKLATKSVLEDNSWIKPGLASWEWWHDAALYGPDVNFVSGCNYDTYKYYIDFASSFHVPYIVMDAGWAETVLNPNKPNSQMRLPELIQYGKDKNVGIILWLSWVAVEQNFDLFKTYEDWGIKGVKIDFMDRSDQWMVNFYERVAKEAAKHHLLVDFHGSFTPGGLEYKYPNVVSYEGVKGLEHMRGCYPDNTVYLPFMRNAVGPMDYTPGPMISMQPELYSALRPNSAGVGTRAFQLATFVLFESGLQMLADNPVNYRKNEDCARFISQVPVTWDQTKALKAKVGEYVIVAKRKGKKWFIGGITNNAVQERKFEIPLDFLEEGRSYRMSSFEDGINANRQAMDYRHKQTPVTKTSSITITMKRNGGFAAVIE